MRAASDFRFSIMEVASMAASYIRLLMQVDVRSFP